MRIRISGTAGQVDVVVDLLRRVLPVTEVSALYPSRRSDDVRVYLTAEAPDWRDADHPMCPWCLLPHTVDQQGRVPDGMAWSCRNCGRTYAMAHGLLIEAVLIGPGETQPGDWVRAPGGWMPWTSTPIRSDHEVMRPSTGRPSDGDA